MVLLRFALICFGATNNVPYSAVCYFRCIMMSLTKTSTILRHRQWSAAKVICQCDVTIFLTFSTRRKETAHTVLCSDCLLNFKAYCLVIPIKKHAWSIICNAYCHFKCWLFIVKRCSKVGLQFGLWVLFSFFAVIWQFFSPQACHMYICLIVGLLTAH